MSNSLYITSMEARAGKAIVALGVAELLAQRVARIAIFRPIVTGAVEHDPLIELLMQRYNIGLGYRDSYGFSYAEALALEASSGRGRVVAEVIDRAAHVTSHYDFVLFIGSDFDGPAPATELALNAEFAVNLAAPVLNVVSGNEKNATELLAASHESQRLLVEHGCEVAATVLNRVAPAAVGLVREHAAHTGSLAPIYVLPDQPVLSALTVDEVFLSLQANVLAGGADQLQGEVSSYLLGSGYLATVLPRLHDAAMLIVSGDRTDLALGIAAATRNPATPTPSGIVFTCGMAPDDSAVTLLAASDICVATVEMDSAAVLHRLDGLRGEIRPGSVKKIAAALNLFSNCVAGDELAARISLSQPAVVTPAMFSAALLARAQADRRTIVLPESDDDRVLRAAAELLRNEAVSVVLLGDVDAVKQRLCRLALELPHVAIIDPVTSPLRAEFAATYAELRAHKGMTVEAAYEVMTDPTYFATMLVHAGIVDGMVSGATHTTAQTIRPALEIIRTEPGRSLVSSAFFMCLPTKVLVFADCAVNPDPTAGQLADIAACTAETAVAFGIEPRVALLSYSSGDSGTGADVEKVRRATAELARIRPSLAVVGPIQYDAAVEPSVAAVKMPDNAIAGRANVLIFPDLNTGNTTYKAVQRSGAAVAIGPVLQGLRRPVNDLSRGCTVDDIVTTVLITCIQSQLSEISPPEQAMQSAGRPLLVLGGQNGDLSAPLEPEFGQQR